MPQFSRIQQVIRPTDPSLSRITDLVVGPDGLGGVLYSTTRFDGMITSWDISGTNLTAVDTDGFASGIIAGNQPDLGFVTTDTGPALLSGGGTGGAWTLRDLDSSGTLGPVTALPASFDALLVQPVQVALSGGLTSVYAGMNGASGLAQIILDSTGAVVQSGIIADRPSIAMGDVTALATATIAGTSFLYVASTQDLGVSVMEVAFDGSLFARSSLRPDDGLWMTTPTAIETVTVAGKTYVIVAGAGSNSLTVMATDDTGALDITSHVIDDRNTRFEGVTALSSASYGDQTWLFAAGSDDGISAFQVLAGGRLLHRAYIADAVDTTLANVSALETIATTGGIAVFVASATEPGLTRLHLEISPDDQVILDSTGSDTLTGGAGADVFVLGADGVTDTITDFMVGTDTLDLSSWAGLRSKDQLFFTSQSNGLRITYGDETLYLLSSTGSSISASALSETDLIAQSTLPQVIVPGLPGPVTTPPDLPDRYLPPAGTPPVTAPLDRIEDYGTGGADTLNGADGNDILFGQSGKDQLRGNAGDDLLFGGPDQDRLWGGADDDQLFGGEGRDLGWLTPARPVQPKQGDQLYGGAGDDVLSGQAGRDTLDGGAGDDILTGGSGRDTFVFGNGQDVITDFDLAVDLLVLDPALWNEALDPAQVVDRFGQIQGRDLVLQFSQADTVVLEDLADVNQLADHITLL